MSKSIWILRIAIVTSVLCGCENVEPPRRVLNVIQSDPYLRSGNLVASRGQTETLTTGEMGDIPLDDVWFIGDSHIYIDVLDYEMLPPSNGDIQIQPGHVVRSFYTNESPTYAARSLDPREIANADPSIQAAIEAGAVPPSFVRGSIRMYDRGECSASISWRSFGERLAEAFDAELDVQIKTFDLPIVGTPCFNPIGNWIVDPLLRDDGDVDTFRFTRGYDLYDCSRGIHLNLPSVTVRVEISMTAVDGVFRVGMVTPSIIVYQNAIVNWFGGDTVFNAFNNAVQGSLAPKLEQTVRAELSQTVPLSRVCDPDDDLADEFCDSTQRAIVAIGTGAPESRFSAHNFVCEPDDNSLGGRCVVVPNIHKINFRPDGFEIVLADEALSDDGLSGDPFYPRLVTSTYNGYSLCDRSVPEVLDSACYQQGIFEIPPRNFPEICGDALMTP